MKFHIDRSLPITLAEQIRGQIVYEISCGALKPGTPLPSVRELADRLNVAPMTIARVYRELSHEQLIVTKPGVGTYVADITDTSLRQRSLGAHKGLPQVADAFIRQALVNGHAPSQIRDTFLSCLERYSPDATAPLVALVGNFRPATDAYAREVERILLDLNVQTRTVLLSELKADPEGVREQLEGVELVIAIPTRLQEIRRLVEPYGYNVVAVAFQASPETRHKIASIPPSARVGVIATYPEFLSSLLEGVISYGLLETPPLYALIDREERVKELLAQVDVVVYASGSERILAWLPNGLEAFEYRHVPDPTSLNRLRPLLSQGTVDREALVTIGDKVERSSD